MGHEFRIENQVELAATPEQVWDAIATGPGLDCWFIGRNDVSPGLGGLVHCDFAGGAIPAATVRVWEPRQRLETLIGPGPDGQFQAQEQLIAARGDGSAVLRIVTSGFLPGDDWEAEFEAMQAGACVFRAALAEYLAHFPGRTGTPITLFGPPIQDWKAAWQTMDEALGLAAPNNPDATTAATPECGEPVHLAPAGMPPLDGVLYAANEQSRSVRTQHGLYRFVQGFGGPMVLCHVLFSPPDGSIPDPHEDAWQAWLARTFA